MRRMHVVDVTRRNNTGTDKNPKFESKGKIIILFVAQ